MQKIYIETCNNLDEYKKIKNQKPIKNKIINKIINQIDNLKFQIKIKCNTIQKIETQEKIIYICFTNETNGKILSKINKKISQILKENSNTNIILSKEIKEKSKKENNIQKIIKNCEENKQLYFEYIQEILNIIIKHSNKIPEEQSIYILIKSNQNQNINKITQIQSSYKMINIITPNIKNFEKLEENLNENLETITILNNKRKSLTRAEYIINIDFEKEEILQYNINRNAIILNTHSTKIEIKNFDGIIINNVKIQSKQEEKYDIQDEYKINKEQIMDRIKKYEFEFIGNNMSMEAKSFKPQ